MYIQYKTLKLILVYVYIYIPSFLIDNLPISAFLTHAFDISLSLQYKYKYVVLIYF